MCWAHIKRKQRAEGLRQSPARRQIGLAEAEERFFAAVLPYADAETDMDFRKAKKMMKLAGKEFFEMLMTKKNRS